MQVPLQISLHFIDPAGDQGLQAKRATARRGQAA